ncbi:MAG: adenylyltransferase/cytidyltransferase family protein [Nanoarchaeota archaeon]
MKIYFPGRFQPFHYGHLEEIRMIKRKFPKSDLYLLVVETNRENFYSPFKKEEVLSIIDSYNPSVQGIEVIRPYEIVFKRKSLIVTGSPLKKLLYDFLLLNSYFLENEEMKNISATKIKRLIIKGNLKEASKYVNGFTLEKLIKKQEEGVLLRNYSENKLKNLYYRFIGKYI